MSKNISILHPKSLFPQLPHSSAMIYMSIQILDLVDFTGSPTNHLNQTYGQSISRRIPAALPGNIFYCFFIIKKTIKNKKPTPAQRRARSAAFSTKKRPLIAPQRCNKMKNKKFFIFSSYYSLLFLKSFYKTSKIIKNNLIRIK